MNKTGKNIAASVRQRLKNRGVKDKRPFNEILQYYAMERFLYRLSQSEHAEKFILKGALMLRVWESPEHRPTMDIDMLGKMNNEVGIICEQVADILNIDVEDGLVFLLETLHGELITEDADYEGVRVTFFAKLDNARVKLQIDIGFGDVVHPEPIEAELPTILDFPAPRLLCYSRESAIAEKFEAMVKLGELNSRMKDFYDIWLLSRQFEFDGEILTEAVRLTLENRGTEIPEIMTVFTEEFVDTKQDQWSAFHNRLEQEYVPKKFGEIVTGIERFLEPVISALIREGELTKRWSVQNYWI
ncbi:MAG: nucleotidyl transferase AbiEii/AbiGii toxin family protein [Gammaproteobacteria bacterium]|nr:nucleotidyl transferase AbiEii/AbiGii toxin family protein [Gammaproteobacteria bacterium]